MISKPEMSNTKDCEECQQAIHIDRLREHMNMHVNPRKLVPKTLANNLQKVGLMQVIQIDDSTDESDIAVRSILSDEVPHPEVERRDISAPFSPFASSPAQ
jgi:hypothetical protein